MIDTFLPVFKFLMYTLDQLILVLMFLLNFITIVEVVEILVALLVGVVTVTLGAVLTGFHSSLILEIAKASISNYSFLKYDFN